MVSERHAVRLEHLRVVSIKGMVCGVRELITIVACHWLCRPECIDTTKPGSVGCGRVVRLGTRAKHVAG